MGGIFKVKTRRPTVLLVDDSPLVRRLLGKHLRAAGFDVRVAKNGKEALALFEDERRDVILSDLRMPLMDGFELLQRIRDRDSDRDQIFIALTAEETSWVRRRALALGANDVVVKSATDDALVNVLAHHLRLHGRPGRPASGR